VAFAPFGLNDTNPSLYSFLDPLMPDETKCKDVADRQSCVSLIEAAVDTARLSPILPPLSLDLETKHWNFVDGGYSDNSGATTALDIYRALKNVPSDEIDLRVILLTSSNPRPNLATDIGKSAVGGAVSWTSALVKSSGNAAVATACDEMYLDPSHSELRTRGCIEHAGVKDGKLQLVEIQEQTPGLSAGWEVSRTTFAVISWMLGKAQDCPRLRETASDDDDLSEQPAGSPNAQLTREILRRNSCVMRLILEQVRG
jgi:hypothetical protein